MHSASSFEGYGEQLPCLMPIKMQKLENSSIVKLVALSDTVTRGLNGANVRRNICF